MIPHGMHEKDGDGDSDVLKEEEEEMKNNTLSFFFDSAIIASIFEQQERSAIFSSPSSSPKRRRVETFCLKICDEEERRKRKTVTKEEAVIVPSCKSTTTSAGDHDDDDDVLVVRRNSWTNDIARMMKQSTGEFITSAKYAGLLEKLGTILSKKVLLVEGNNDDDELSRTIMTKMLECVIYGRQDGRRVKVLGGKRNRHNDDDADSEKQTKKKAQEEKKMNGPLVLHTFISTIFLMIGAYMRTKENNDIVSEISKDISSLFHERKGLKEGLEILLETTESIWMFSPHSHFIKYSEKVPDIISVYMKREKKMGKNQDDDRKQLQDEMLFLHNKDIDLPLRKALLASYNNTTDQTPSKFHLGNFIKNELTRQFVIDTETKKARKCYGFRHIMYALTLNLKWDLAFKLSVSCMFNQGEFFFFDMHLVILFFFYSHVHHHFHTHAGEDNKIPLSMRMNAKIHEILHQVLEEFLDRKLQEEDLLIIKQCIEKDS